MVPTPAHLPPVSAYIYQHCEPEFGKTKAEIKAKYYTPLILRAAHKYHLKPLMVASLIWHESNFNPREISSAGALGLTQIMPMWFETYHLPLRSWRDPEVNLDLGLKLFTQYRTQMAKIYHGLTPTQLDHRALVCYNMGPGAVHRGIYRSRYSKKILADLKYHPRISTPN